MIQIFIFMILCFAGLSSIATNLNLATPSQEIINCEPKAKPGKFIEGYNYTIKDLPPKKVYLQHHFSGDWIPCKPIIIDEVYYAQCSQFDYPYRGKVLLFLHDEFICKTIVP